MWLRGVAIAMAVLIALFALAFFGYRAIRHLRYMHAEQQPIHAWMSVPFVAHTHHVPKAVLYAAIGAQPREHDHRSLRAIAREQKRSVDDVIRDLEKAIVREHGKTP